jgi:hypothetical protein
MPSATVIPTSINTILLAMRAQLATVLALDPTRILISARNKIDHMAAERDIILRPKRGDPRQGTIDAAGWQNPRMVRRVSTICRARVGNDRGTEDRLLLTDPTRGLYQLEELVMSALQEFFPTDGGGNSLVNEGIFFDGIDESHREDEQRDWVESLINWRVDYCVAKVFAAQQ